MVSTVNQVDLIKQFLGFWELLRSDTELSKADITLYLAILWKWNRTYRKSIYFPIDQEIMMRFSRIGNTKTYTNSLKKLANKKMIQYKPGLWPKKAQVLVNEIVMVPVSSKSYNNDSSSTAKPSYLENTIATESVSKKQLPIKEKDFKNEKEENLNQGIETFNNKKGSSTSCANLLYGLQKEKSPPHPKNEAIETLYQKYLTNKSIWSEIKPEFCDTLGFKITSNDIQKAKPERRKMLMGSNEQSNLDLLKAYERDELNDKLLELDFPNLANIAKRLVVVNYFNKRRSVL